jgi:type III pantothenate kinase
MLLCVDVGNSHTVSGIFDQGRLRSQWRLKSDRDRTSDELAIRYHSLFQMAGMTPDDINGFILASVVPTLETSWLHFAGNYLAKHLASPPINVTHLTDTGITVSTDNPCEVGADRIVNSVAAWHLFKSPLLVIDFGTAITFDCVNDQQQYIGGAIMPGIGISLDALAGRTAKLPRIDIEQAPERAVGKSTVDAIRSGILYGFGGMVDRMVEKLTPEVAPDGKMVQVIATGGMAHLVKPYSQTISRIDPLLTLNGLRLIHERNNKQRG